MITPEPESIAIDIHKPGVASAHLSEIVIAKSITQAVLRLAWIVDMSAGPFQGKATYGLRERVNGVVLRHTESWVSAVEISVVMAEKALLEVFPFASERSAAPGTAPTLLRLADQLRVVVYQTAQALGLSELTTVDVSIDDIR